MEESFNAVVLGLKHMNHFILKEYDTFEAHRYQKLEKVLQRSYTNKSGQSKDEFKVGSYVAAHVSFGSEKGPKLWLRGVIRENYHQKDFLYGIHFGDYGFDKTCHKSDVRTLMPYHYPEYVQFQEFNFYLTDIDHKPGIDREDVLKEIRNQFEAKDFVVLLTVEGRDRKGSIYGSIQIEKDCDLAAILLEKELVNDAHYCGRYSTRSVTRADNKGSQESVGPLPLPGPFRSGTKASRANACDLICKCDSVIKYKRKLMSNELELILKDRNSRSDREPVSELFLNTI